MTITNQNYEGKVYPTLEEIVSYESIRQDIFPVTKSYTYLAHAQIAPLPSITANSIKDYLNKVTQEGQFGKFRYESEERCRLEASRILGTSPKEIALLGPTSLGLSIIANGLRLDKGDNIIIDKDDFISNVLPWKNLRKRGVEIHEISSFNDGVSVESLSKLVDSKTRLVAISWVHHITGKIAPLEEISNYLKDLNVFLSVDAIQGLGACEFPKGCFDFLAADSYKWLLGPSSTGILSIKSDLLDKHDVTFIGWHSVEDDPNEADPPILKASAQRYEGGTLNSLGIVGLAQSLRLLNNIGIKAIHNRIKSLIQLAYDGLTSKGFTVIGDPDWRAESGILSFFKEDWNPTNIYNRLLKEKIIVSIKDIPHREKCIRISPHFYQSTSDVERFLSML